MYVSNVLKVLYSPRKTLKEVIQNPRYIGPLLIMLLLIAVNVASTYAVLSKEYYEQILPSGTKLDEWTENSTFWTSNANITESSDAINGSIYGNASIAFSIQNSPQVWMQLTGIGTVDCSVPNGFNLLSFRIKWTSPVTQPENVTIQIFSLNSSSDYFYSDLKDTFSNATYNIWNNVTIPLDSSAWSGSSRNADWGNVTGLQLQFTWAGNSNVTLLVDGMFFHGPFKSLLETGGTSYLLDYGVSGAFQFIITWILLTGLIYVLVRAFKGKVFWKPMLIAVGFILMTMFVGALINGIGYSTLPTIRFPFELIGGVQGEGTVALNAISSQTWLVTQIGTVAELLVWAWTAALASLVVRAVAEFSWAKSVAVAIIAYVITIFIAGIIA
ncbi:MAG: Yip1 family protein [Candidatus Bathyarchaeia archaeon]